MQQAIDQLAFKKNQETRINGLTQKELDAFKRSMQINSLTTAIDIPKYVGINNIPLFHSNLITIPPQVRSIDFTLQASVTSQLIEIWKKALKPVIPINN